MKKIIITADSTFDLPLELSKKYDINVIPSYVLMDGKTYDDYPDLKQQDLFSYYNDKEELPKTAAANAHDYQVFFNKFIKDDNYIIHIAKSSYSSSCYNNAFLAASENENIFIFDSMSISGGSAILAMEASKLRDTKTPEEIILDLEKLREKIVGSFILKKLEFLHKGGRCSSLQFHGANILKLRPKIDLISGEMIPGKKYRGKFKKVLTYYIEDIISEIENYENDYVIINHTLKDEKLLEKAVNTMKDLNYFKNIYVWNAGTAVSCHCGPDTFGMFVIKK